MSVLETPRILFRGNMAWDPIVTNNNGPPYPPAYDENEAVSVYPDVPTIQAKVAAFRQQAIEDVDPFVNPQTGPNRVWNPQGTHRSSFYDEAFPDAVAPQSAIVESCVSGVDTGGGASTSDAFVGAPARFNSMLVDLEPYGSYSSQLFFDTMSFGIDGGCRIFCPRTARVTDRYINLGRNPVYYIAGFASVVWQTSFAKADGLTIDPYDSTALQQLCGALDAEDVLGLTVRWTVYRTIYYDTPALAGNPTLQKQVAQQLIAKLNGGGFQPNPARSKLVGVIGLWRENEPAHEPGDRALLATQWPPGRPADPPCVATAFARLDTSSITLDLGNAMPETGLDLTKQNWGDLQVQAVDPADPTNPIKLGDPIPYDDYSREAYEAGSGIVTVAVDPDAARASATIPIQVVQLSTGTALLQETQYRAIPLIPNLYLDAGQDFDAEVQVYEWGVPAGAGVPVTIAMMDYSGGNYLGSTQTATVAGGIASFPTQFGQGPINAYVPLPGANPQLPTGGINTQINTYLYVRYLPADSAIAALPATWDNVYANVLANWKAMAPCMDNWLDLDDEAQVLAYATVIKRLTDPGAFEDFRFMPVTRDMSPGARTLLYNFLDGVAVAEVEAEAPSTRAAPVAAAAPAVPRPAPESLAGMSQKMR